MTWQQPAWRLYERVLTGAHSAPGASLVLGALGLGRRFDTLVRRAVLSTLPNPVSVRGLTLHYPSAGVDTIPQMAAGNFEPETARCIETSLQPGMTMVDLGAHIGYFSLLAARRAGRSGKVFAFEPEPRAFAMLAKNVEANGESGVVVPVQKAISGRSGSATLFLGTHDTVAANIYGPEDGDGGTVSVDTVALDDFLAEQGWPAVNVIKMDVQGAEEPALAGMKETLARNPELRLIIDFCPYWIGVAGGTPAAMLNALACHSFSRFTPLQDGAQALRMPQGLPELVRRAGDMAINVLCER